MKEIDKIEMLELLNKVNEIALQAGKVIMDIYKKEDFEVEMKSDDSPLTMADKAAHEVIKTGLQNITPDIPVLSEEGKNISFEERKNWDRFWIVDPLDGTKEFIKKNGEFTVNIALIKNRIPVVGVIFAPALKKLYYASNGNGAYLSETDNKFEISNVRKLENIKHRTENLTAVESRSHSSLDEEEILKKYNVSNTISIGSSLKFCMVAEGKADLYYRHGPTMEWDVAAGYMISIESGCNVTGLEFNKENLLNSSFIVLRS